MPCRSMGKSQRTRCFRSTCRTQRASSSRWANAASCGLSAELPPCTDERYSTASQRESVVVGARRRGDLKFCKKRIELLSRDGLQGPALYQNCHGMMLRFVEDYVAEGRELAEKVWDFD